MAKDWVDTLIDNKLATFEQVWDCPIQPIDVPNTNRGGYSSVGRINLVHNGHSVTLYCKKQSNHTTRSFWHPLKGEPTFAKEFRMLGLAKSCGITVPKVVSYAEQHSHEGLRAFLLTENLAGYKPLDEILGHKDNAFGYRRAVLKKVAFTLSLLHHEGIHHRALYPKHIFVKTGEADPDIALIDFEKARRMTFNLLQSFADLATLNYRTLHASRTMRMYFLLHYLRLNKLNIKAKYLWRCLSWRTLRKMKQWEREHV